MRAKGARLLRTGFAAMWLSSAVACGSPVRPVQPKLTESSERSAPEKDRRKKVGGENSLPMPQGDRVSFHREMKRVSSIRNLPVRGETIGLLVERSELLAHIKRAVALETPDHALLGTEYMLVGLGLAPSDFDFKEAMLGLLADNLQGLYDPHLKTMMVRADLKANRLATLRHELVHALQDQNYDLSEIVKWHPDDTDRSSALSCLAEGDATSAMFDAMLPDNQTALELPAGFIQRQFIEADEKKNEADDTPTVVRRSLGAPYIDGVGFVHALRKRGGWEEVNRVWKNPPTTTEQILHLEKYDSQEAAIPVPLPKPPSDDWTLVLSDTWGEQSLRLVLEQWASEGDARTAAAGWGGDRIAAYQRGEEQAVVWRLQMDSEKDATELFKLVSKRSSQKKKKAPASQLTSTIECRKSEGRYPVALAVSQFGTTIRLTSGFLKRAGGSKGNCSQAQGWNETLSQESKPTEN